MLWDTNVQCDNVIEARRPDIIVIDNKERKGIIIDIAVPADVRVGEKEREKVGKCQDLKREIRRLWKLKMVEVVPVVIGALGSVTKGFDRWIEKLGIPLMLEECKRLPCWELQGYRGKCWKCEEEIILLASGHLL